MQWLASSTKDSTKDSTQGGGKGQWIRVLCTQTSRTAHCGQLHVWLMGVWELGRVEVEKKLFKRPKGLSCDNADLEEQFRLYPTCVVRANDGVWIRMGFKQPTDTSGVVMQLHRGDNKEAAATRNGAPNANNTGVTASLQRQQANPIPGPCQGQSLGSVESAGLIPLQRWHSCRWMTSSR
jgi:hypothetical protein